MSFSSLLILIILPVAVLGQDRITGLPFATRSQVFARNGMAATSQPLATTVALDILQRGGNAIDAAIAANAMLCLVEPTGSGLGGDIFAMVWDGEAKTLTGLNGSGRSPRSLTLEMLRAEGRTSIPSHGPLPVSVPGCVDGWFMLHSRFGRLPMAEILAPAIRYAKEGFPVSDVIAHYWSLSVPVLSPYPGFLETFAPQGHAPEPGEIFRNPRLARTLEALVEGGRDAFYKGEIARKIASYMEDQGGYLSYEDLAAHAGEWVDPVSTSYRGVDVWELPPNGQGIAALQMLNVLERYDVASMGPTSADYVHLFAEAKKLAFEDRARFYADPDFSQIPVHQLISKQYAQQRSELIDMQKARQQVPHGDPAALEEGDTVYLSVADKDGNMVSLIQSNYRGMGSGMTPGDLGFILQDRGELFSLEQGHPNVFEPGKRPFHTIIPAFATREGEAWLCFGVMGGATQPQGHVQILVNLIDFGMNVQEAGDSPRILHYGSTSPTASSSAETMTNGGWVALEQGYSDEVLAELKRRGHQLKARPGSYGGYQGILRDPESGVYAGASESRKDGHAAGY